MPWFISEKRNNNWKLYNVYDIKYGCWNSTRFWLFFNQSVCWILLIFFCGSLFLHSLFIHSLSLFRLLTSISSWKINTILKQQQRIAHRRWRWRWWFHAGGQVVWAKTSKERKKKKMRFIKIAMMGLRYQVSFNFFLMFVGCVYAHIILEYILAFFVASCFAKGLFSFHQFILEMFILAYKSIHTLTILNTLSFANARLLPNK